MNFVTILIIVTLIIVGYFISIYNKFVSLQAGIDAAWSDIDIQLKKRLNLIPALIDTIKGYKNYEASTLQKIIEARNLAINAKDINQKAKANSTLNSALSSLFALAENYPELKANQNFLNLQENLQNIEEAIANARRYYNAIVRDYNSKIKSFPDLIIAQKFNFQPREYFELETKEKELANKMPKIDFN
jgi:LemA protein